LGRGDLTNEEWARPKPYLPKAGVERTILALKNSRAVATRFDKRAYVFHGTVTLASIRLRS
jgi:transposase